MNSKLIIKLTTIFMSFTLINNCAYKSPSRAELYDDLYQNMDCNELSQSYKHVTSKLNHLRESREKANKVNKVVNSFQAVAMVVGFATTGSASGTFYGKRDETIHEKDLEGDKLYIEEIASARQCAFDPGA